jgi:hypothetical protein
MQGIPASRNIFANLPDLVPEDPKSLWQTPVQTVGKGKRRPKKSHRK